MSQPSKVYRYQRFSDLSLSALCHDQIYYSDPSNFNDPLDCKPHVESNSSLEELRLILTGLIQLRVESETIAPLKNAKLDGNGAKQHVKVLAAKIAENELNDINYNARNPDNEFSISEEECWLLTYAIQSELIKRYDKGICCFSSTQVNPLLWSHYADEHKGICVEYGVERKPKPSLHKVDYDAPRMINTSVIAKAILEGDKSAKAELDQAVLLRKAKPWEYEDEWRLFGNQGLQDSPMSLNSITFGLRCPDTIKHSIIRALVGRTEAIKFFNITQTIGSFTLKSEPFEVDDIMHFPKTARSPQEMFGGVLD